MSQNVSGKSITIRLFQNEDTEAIWPIMQEVISKGEYYVFYPDSSKEKMLGYWLAPGKRVYVATISDKIVGTFTIKDNQPDLGSHIANASYMVHPDYSGKGIGRMLGEHSLAEAKRLGYLAMQFNIVIKSNERAVALWKSLGFQVIGEIPKAFKHHKLGYSNAYIMYREL